MLLQAYSAVQKRNVQGFLVYADPRYNEFILKWRDNKAGNV